MPAITKPMKVNLLKSRCGRLWNMPYRDGELVAKDTKCPLCGDPDSAGHILGHCQHKELKAHYIARHDMAMRKIIKEVMKGQSGSHFIITDNYRIGPHPVATGRPSPTRSPQQEDT